MLLTSMTLEKAVDAFITAQRGEIAESTLTWYTNRLSALADALGNKRIHRIKPDDLRKWRASLLDREVKYEDHPLRPKEETGLSVYSIHGYIRAAKRLFNWLVEERQLKHSPADRLRLPKLPDEPPKEISDDDLQALLDAARASGARDHALVMVLADTGARVAGIAGLTLEDVDLESGTLTVREKGQRWREVYLSQDALDALDLYLAHRRDDPDTNAVFLSRCHGRGLSRSGIYQVLKRLAKRAGIDGRFNPHAFRHGFARSLLKNGADLGTVSELMGHSDIGVTERFYGRWTKEELKERHHEFSRIRNLTGENGNAHRHNGGQQ